ncbi:MAG: 4Fe-4S dicluster domain-containing protein [Promethearchaeota archaeon]
MDEPRKIVDIYKLDYDFPKYIKQTTGSNPFVCFTCRTCSSLCTSGKVDVLNIAKIVRQIALGLKDSVLSSKEIWTCATCMKCQEFCPQGVNPLDLIYFLQNKAVQARMPTIPTAYVEMVKNIIEIGLIQPPQEVISADFDEFDREELGLPELSMPDAEKIKMNLLKTGFRHVIK